MITQEQVLEIYERANPIHDAESMTPIVDAASYLATFEKGSSGMTRLDTEPETPKKKQNRGLILGLAASIAVILAVTLVQLISSSDNDPMVATTTVSTEAASPEELVLTAYAAARNAGDIDAVVELFESHGEQKRHPLDPVGYLNGRAEIRTVESQIPAVQGSGSGVEFFDIELSDGSSTLDPDVTFRWRFLYGADGTDSDGEPGCVGGKNGAAFIENGRIAFIDWGFEDPTACDS